MWGVGQGHPLWRVCGEFSRPWPWPWLLVHAMGVSSMPCPQTGRSGPHLGAQGLELPQPLGGATALPTGLWDSRILLLNSSRTAGSMGWRLGTGATGLGIGIGCDLALMQVSRVELLTASCILS